MRENTDKNHDPITLDEIPAIFLVECSNNKQRFDVRSLVTFHNLREIRKRDIEKNYKQILNPLTNLPFEDNDVQKILFIAKKNSLIINTAIETKPKTELVVPHMQPSHTQQSAIQTFTFFNAAALPLPIIPFMRGRGESANPCTMM